MSLDLKKFSGVYLAEGQIRRVIFEAKDGGEAQLLAKQWGMGVERETVEFSSERPLPIPEAYNEKVARHLLGGISRTTLYAELAIGRLARVKHGRRLLITRQSIERWCEAD